MTKKKQRRDRAKREDKRQKAKTDVLLERGKQAIIQNVQFERWIEVLKPLYPLLTSLEILKNSPVRPQQVLKMINVQDYETNKKELYSYSVSLKMHIQDLFQLQIAISGIEISSDKTLELSLKDGECIFVVELLGGSIQILGSFEDEAGDLVQCLENVDGHFIKEILGPDTALDWKLSIEVDVINIQSALVEAGLNCDRNNCHKNGNGGMMQYFAKRANLANLALSETLPNWARQAFDNNNRLGHQRLVLLQMTPWALKLRACIVSTPWFELYLNWTTYLNDETLIFSFKEDRPIHSRDLPLVKFSLTGIPIATKTEFFPVC